MNDDMIGTIGLKINSSSTPNAKCIKIIRKYNPSSIAEIIKTINNNDYILVCSAIDTSNIKKIKRCYKELTKNGIAAQLYDFDEPTSLELISNLINTHAAIDLEVQAQIDAEVKDKE